MTNHRRMSLELSKFITVIVTVIRYAQHNTVQNVLYLTGNFLGTWLHVNHHSECCFFRFYADSTGGLLSILSRPWPTSFGQSHTQYLYVMLGLCRRPTRS